MLKKILLIGGGGNCKQVIDCILNMNQYSDLGIIEKDAETFAEYAGITVVGSDEELPRLFKEGWKEAFISLGSIGNTDTRRMLFDMTKDIGYTMPVIVDPSATISRGVEIGEGSWVQKGAIIDADVKIGKGVIVNKGVIISHDCEIGDFVHLSPGSIILGNVKIGDDTHIGAGTTVRQQLTIGNKVMIGMGSVVVKDVPSGYQAFGNPCELKKKIFS